MLISPSADSRSKSIITVVTVCDNHFALMLAALLKSMELQHKSGEMIQVYIVDDKISASNRQRIQQSVTLPFMRLQWIKMQDAIPENMALPTDNSTFPLNAYMRLFIPYFLPAEVTKAIYLDVDMILMNDISELWKINIGDCVAGAVVDRAETISNPWGGVKNYQELGLDPDAPYYNSGMLLMNLPKWKEMNITSTIIKVMNDNTQYAAFPDQYGLNVVLVGKWMSLDPRWNNYAFREDPTPYIIHFVGVKPIFKNYNFIGRYRDHFFEYLEQTAWKGYKPKSNISRMVKKVTNVLKKKIKLVLK